jgi:hypothetical protein
MGIAAHWRPGALPYPFFLFLGGLGFLLSASGHGGTGGSERAIPLLYAGYPVILAVFWLLSWRAFRAGRTTLAQVIALPPALLGAGCRSRGTAGALMATAAGENFSCSTCERERHVGLTT